MRRLLPLALVVALVPGANASVQVGNTSTEYVSFPAEDVPLVTAAARLTNLLPESGPHCFVNRHYVWECTYRFTLELSVTGLPAIAFAGDDKQERAYVVHPNGGEPLSDPVGYAVGAMQSDYTVVEYTRTFWPTKVDQTRGYIIYQMHVCIDYRTAENSTVCRYWIHHVPVLRQPTPCTQTMDEGRVDGQVQEGADCAAENGEAASNTLLSLVNLGDRETTT